VALEPKLGLGYLNFLISKSHTYTHTHTHTHTHTQTHTHTHTHTVGILRTNDQPVRKAATYKIYNK